MEQSEVKKEFRQEHREFMAQFAGELNGIASAVATGSPAPGFDGAETLKKCELMLKSLHNTEVMTNERPHGAIEKEKWLAIIMQAIITVLQSILAGQSNAVRRDDLTAEEAIPTDR